MNFDRPIDFDLADTKSTLPPTLQSLDAEHEQDSSVVTFRFNGSPEVRTFREEGSFVVDVGTAAGAASPPAGEASASEAPQETKEAAKDKVPAIEAPQTVPVAGGAPEPSAKPPVAMAPAAPVAKPAAESKAPGQAAAVTAVPAVPEAAKFAPPATEAEQKSSPAGQPDAASPPPAPAASVQVPAQPLAQEKQETKESKLTVALHKLGANVRLDFPFSMPTPAAAFRRSDTLWLVFDSAAEFDVAALRGEEERAFKAVSLVRGDDGTTAVRIRLDRSRLVSMAPEGPGWAVTIGDSITDPAQPLQVARSVVGKNRSNIVIPFQNARALHRVADPEVGDTLMVVTALAPARGFLKPQDFVELKTLASAHGIVVQPLADDISTEIGPDKIVISRPGGLMLSTAGLSERDTGGVVSPVMFDAQTWGFDREAKFTVRQSELIWKAAAAPEGKRRAARLNLARFYMARDMMPEAKAVLDVAIADERGGEDMSAQVLRAAANVMLGRTEDALKELAVPQIANQGDAPLWRAMALARQGSWPEAREAFKKTEASLSTLPLELQRTVMLEAARAAIEVRDFTGAAKVVNDFEVLGVPHELEPAVALINGRLNEALGRREEALSAYRVAADSRDRRAAAQGRLRAAVVRYETGDLKRPGAIDELESLTATWRGDETESEGLKLLAHMYTEEGRYRDAFHTMRTALLAHPNSDLTRKIQDEAAASFDALFLAGKGDAMPPIEALGLFYDYRELTPIGRRGDEMIRKLADRLVSVDLLEQAAELLQHQVDHRLQGAARAQVATRLATIYLMNRKP
ncbi:MAG: tetratricopeptide repeat protein, partial [Pseudolabrys sp.]|nr:tetratricopeptide repeat protein [Pseudolabrys sp.]